MSNPPNGGLLRLPPSHGMWRPIDVVASTGSTNADLLAEAGRGAAEGRVLAAEEQTAGRGRLGRTWTSVPGASLTFSVLLRPAAVPPSRRGWLPLLAGIAVATAVRAVTGVPAVLKWPNDVLVDDRKVAGILAEQSPDAAAVVIGTGLNVATPPGALPVSPAGLPATSLLAEGATVSRAGLLLSVLDELERWYRAFLADPDPFAAGLLAAYLPLSATLGQQVEVTLPGGRVMKGTAVEVDADGRLVIGSEARVPVSAGDVIHLRS
jgi:BirA family transcriptional regulator, biotin operon repressor / biotin---[acetyl-CoA-carboxylase] ligase